MTAEYLKTWLNKPGQSGWVGGLLDEYARAADEFCRVVEAVDDARWKQQRPAPEIDGMSIQNLCCHVLASSRGYARHILRTLDMPLPAASGIGPEQVPAPASVRPLLVESLHLTERALEPCAAKSDTELEQLLIHVNWAPPLTVDLLVEHAIVHLLRHRRQVERWE